jgi:tetratricopeptide (TPR) repeat protein
MNPCISGILLAVMVSVLLYASVTTGYSTESFTRGDFGQALFNQANDYYSRSEYKRAIILYRKAGKNGIDPGIIAFNIGNCFFQAGDLPAAAAAYRRAVTTSDGRLINALFNLAGVQFQLRNYGESIAAYRRGLSRDPQNASAWLYLAEAYDRTGDRIGAQHALESAIKRVPGDASIYYQLAELHVKLGEIDEAVRLVKQAYGENGAETDFLFYLADLYTANNDTTLAIAAFREALSADPDNYAGHYRFADLLARSNQKFLAMELLTRALSIKPDYTDAAIYLGNIAIDLMWWDKALAAYRQALRYNNSEGILGIINIAYELATRKDLDQARKVGAIIDSLQLSDPALKREWDQVGELLRDKKR